MRCAIFASLLGLVAAAQATAEFSGEATAEARWFVHATPDPRQDQADRSITATLDYFRDWDKTRQRFAVSLRGRVDSDDGERSKWELDELYWRYQWRRASISVGVDRVFWGVTEALHLVDIVNQTDLVESPDGEDKLGQPMLRLTLSPRWGTWDFFVLPRFRERTFPGRGGRLRGPFRIAADEAQYESQDGKTHVDLALRYSHYIGNVEFALSHFSGTDRAPLFVPAIGSNPLAPARIAPFYYLTDQTGLETTLVAGNWLWKLEAVSRRDPLAGRYGAATGGFEYSFYGIGGTNSDLGVIAEYQYDSRNDPLNGFANGAFDDDLVLGARWALNDFAGSEVLLLVSRDLANNGQLASLEASRRLNNDWRVALEARQFSADTPADPLLLFDREDYWQLSITRFF